MKKLLLLSASIILIFMLYFGWQYLRLNSELPQKNLSFVGSSSCYIFFNVWNKGKSRKVVISNSLAHSIITRGGYMKKIMYPLYMNEVIKRDLTINVTDSTLLSLEPFVVIDSLVKKFEHLNPLTDSTVVDGNKLKKDFSQDEYNAIIYVLLKRGINCCDQDESGQIFVENVL